MSHSPLDGPDYAKLVSFLVTPFLESPDSLRTDCEIIPAKARIWIRLAFAGSDKGRVFGRGGRTIQAIRTVVATAAQAHGHSVYLDIYETQGPPRKPEVAKKIPDQRHQALERE